VGGLAVVGVIGPAGPAGADAVTPAGACVVTAAWEGAAFTRASTDLSPDDVVEIPRVDRVAWSGQVVGASEGTPRTVDGHLALDLPPLLGSIPLGTWSGQAVEVERSGIYSYDLPAIVPAGVRLQLNGRHDEGGRRRCAAAFTIMIAGGPFDSPLIWVALVGLLLSGGALALVGRAPTHRPGIGRLVAGAAVGLPLGLFAGLTLVLLGVLALASPWVTVLLGLGPVLGAVWARWSPIRSGDARVRAAA
jgi:hypothetical protein